MIKTATITFHRANNNGSFLQTYALQKTILNFDGVTNEIIDFQTKSQVQQYQIFRKNNSIKNFIRNCISCLNYQGFKSRKKSFDNMFEKFYKLNQSYYNEKNELAELESKYDIFIAGSDQIWNVNARDHSDAYFLDFVKGKKKIAYAPSFGSLIQINEEQKSKIGHFLDDFDKISVREQTGKKLIDSLVNRDVPIVLDPTLLLEKKDYSILEKKERSIIGKYIFYYSINYNADSLKTVQKFAEIHNLPVVVVYTTYNVYKCSKYGFKILTSAGPDTFLEIIKNAEYVLSNSFHGTVFAIIYQKQFYTIANIKNNKIINDDRIANILHKCDLTNRQLTVKSKITEFQLDDIDYKNVENLLHSEVEKSMDILKNMLFD